MKYVSIEEYPSPWPAKFLDPRPYLRELAHLAGQLPEGARRFASDENHYDFGSERCIKDLKLRNLQFRDGDAKIFLEAHFEGNALKHDGDLVIKYVDVVEVEIKAAASVTPEFVRSETTRLGDVQLDEILPHDAGCSHEVALTGGLVFIACSDLTAEWVHRPELAESRLPLD